MRLYAEHKRLRLDRVTVRLTHNKIHAEDCLNCETKEGMIDRIDRNITIEGRSMPSNASGLWRLLASVLYTARLNRKSKSALSSGRFEFLCSRDI
jgi:hypothetical protein